jgi:hypothetical protein
MKANPECFWSGMVMCTTSSITSILGYPRDMWNGRSFIDFVHPKDRLTFTNTITSGVTLPFGDQLRVKVISCFLHFLYSLISSFINVFSFNKNNLTTQYYFVKGKSGLKEDFHFPRPGRRPNTFYCRLRLYNGLRQGKYSIRERTTTYNPFKLAVCFKVFQ